MKKISLVLLISIAISLTAFAVVKQWEENKRQQEYNHRANAHTAAMAAGFQNIAKQLEDMRFLLEYDINNEQNNPRKPHEFMDMLTPILSHEPALVDIDWAVLDPDSQQAHIVYSLKHQSNIETNPVPINYKALTARVIKGGENQYLLQLITPVTNQINPINQPQLQGEVVAALVSEWDIKTIIEQALKLTPVSAQDIRIINVEDNKKTELYFHASRSRTAADKNVHTDVRYTTTFPFTNLTLQAEYEAAPKFLKDFPLVLAWQTLFIWLVISVLLAWYIYKKDKYTKHVERLVEKRTQTLNKKRKKLRRIIENLQGIYYHINLEGNIQMVSPAIALLGYTEDEVLGTNMSDYTLDQDTFKNILLALQQSEKGKVRNFHIQVKHHNGSILWLSMNAQYMHNNDKEKVIGIEGTLRDFTKSKENQEKIKQADKLELLGIMAGGIAHNFNNILTAILGHASIARLKLKKDSPLIHHLDTIETSSLQAAEICNQMLAYTGQGKYTGGALNLSLTVENINLMVQASFSDQADIEYKLQTELPSIQADSSQVQQLVIALILNAVEAYQNQQGHVLVQTGCKAMQKDDFKDCLDSEDIKAGDYVFLRVIDEGCGISREMQQRIFEPFVTTKFTGRGLGLSAVRGIVRSHHGVIRLQSTEGKGTTITIFFPVDSAPA